ncbi:MAG: hypothetical protein H6712_05960 [Myxococcales bacterium]|nr:hypothetical protein [Myxococcales bacterium]MCB9713381.1 hypothetical protein [Myxococcales bacterium]
MLRHRLPGSRVTAVLLACTLGGAGTTASAAPGEPALEADPLAEAQALYDKGRAKFETADYHAAVELWTEAYALVPDTADGGQTKVLLIYNIATAREKAFEVTQDPVELRQARILLSNFEQSIATLYGEGEEADAERARVQEKIAALDDQLAELDHAQGPDDGTAPQPEPETPPEVVEPGTDEPPPNPAARGLVIGGAVSLSLGVAGLAMMGAGLGMGSRANDISDLQPDAIDARRDRFERGRTGNVLAIAGGVTAGVLVVTGSVLLALGMRRKKASAVALVPGVGPRGAALVLRGRF